MVFKATDEEVAEMAKLAILASHPVGLGFLHYDETLKKEDIKIKFDGLRVGVSVDYFQGRMVKLWIRRTGDGDWEASDNISPEYESWISTYSSYADLLNVARRNLSQSVTTD